MNDSPLSALLQSIEDSRVLDPDQKRVLVNISPRLNEEQKAVLAAFFAKEKVEFAKIEEKYREEKAPIYKEYLGELKQAFIKAEKTIAAESEKSSASKEQKVLDDLLNQL